MTRHRQADVVAEVLWCRGWRSAEDIAAALGMRPGSVARALHRAGRHDLAVPFDEAHHATTRSPQQRRTAAA